MTSRLRHKLDDLEASGSNLNESFCQIGTPLPSLADTKRDEGEFVPVWKQEVRDEQGRRRLHGAFTGGFSAGYFNSVGSKEGWTPSTFVSSRSNRAKKVQTAEDFMDEEDLADLRESRVLENTEGFRTDEFGGTATELAGKGKGAGLPSALQSLVQPAPTSVGRTLLLKLGWRPGQGIGPRLSARALAHQSAKLGFPPPITSYGDDEDVEAKKHTFAPRDRKLEVYEAKTGKEGLGFVKGGAGRLKQTSVKAAAMSAGFGFGIDDADEDDADIYASAGPSNSRLDRDNGGEGMAYDMGVDEEGGRDVILLGNGDGNRRADSSSRAGLGQGVIAKPRKPLLNSDIDNRRWHDGRPLIPGFVLDTTEAVQDKWFDFPMIPADWHPRPARVWNKVNRWDKRGDEPKAEPPSGLGMGRRVQLTAEQRGEKLGEEPPKAPIKSVFEYMSAKSKERLAQYAATSQAAPVAAPAQQSTLVELSDVEVPPLSPRTASAALHGFQPFGDDLAKQERYRSYLISQTHNSPAPNPKILPSSSIDDVNRELSDFVKSANIFKPMSFAMSSRFTTATSSHQDTAQPQPGLHVPDPDKVDEWKDRTAKEEETKEILTPRQEAARAGMYGNLTRSKEDWYPNKLLCKRFGVADPHPDGPKNEDGSVKETTKTGVVVKPLADMSWTDKYIPAQGSSSASTSTPKQIEAPPGTGNEPVQRQPKSMAEVGMAEDVNQGKDILTYTKPSIDIFKAIFEDDSSDDEGEEDVEENPIQVPGGKVPGPSSHLGLSDPVAAASIIGDRLSEPSLFPKPIFTSKSAKRDRDDTNGDDDPSRPTKERKKEKSKSKKDKEKKKSKILMSFDVADDDEDGDNVPAKPKQSKPGAVVPKSKLETPHRPENVSQPLAPMVVDDEDDWVEKEVVVPGTRPAVSGRRRAEDYL